MNRIATCERKTKETTISITLNLDGTGKTNIHTGIGFFDHMLDGMARHGLFDLSVSVAGDLDVDCHHTIEDTGIVLGLSLIHIYKEIEEKAPLLIRIYDLIITSSEKVDVYKRQLFGLAAKR